MILKVSVHGSAAPQVSASALGCLNALSDNLAGGDAKALYMPSYNLHTHELHSQPAMPIGIRHIIYLNQKGYSNANPPKETAAP